ncbi:MAG: hypothetical protein H6724_01275 [Sandaracinus sp.]|nr:hypothetical protein [Sandaracinus sp.]
MLGDRAGDRRAGGRGDDRGDEDDPEEPSTIEANGEAPDPAPMAPTREEGPPSSGRPPIVDPARTRSLRQEVAELRRLVGAGDLATAAPRFVALANREAGNARLHCEAGFVALRAGDRDAAETQIEAGLAVFRRRAGVETEADRVPYAMCLYNRGRLAQGRRGSFSRDHELPSVAHASTERDGADPARRSRSHAGGRGSDRRRGGDLRGDPDAGGRERRLSPGGDRAHDASGPRRGRRLLQDSVVVHDAVAGELEVPLVSACPDTFSIFRDDGSVAEAAWVDAGAPFGRVFRVAAYYGGQGRRRRRIRVGAQLVDHALRARGDRRGVEGRPDPLESWREADCMNEPCDDPDTTEDDGQDLRAPYAHHFRLVATIAAGALTLRLDHEAGARASAGRSHAAARGVHRVALARPLTRRHPSSARRSFRDRVARGDAHCGDERSTS